MDLNELIVKTENQRNTVLELIQDPKKTVDELDKEMAVERFLKGFLDDLKRLRESQNSSTSESALPISDVVGQSEQLVCPHNATRTPNEEITGKCRQCGRNIKAN